MSNFDQTWQYHEFKDKKGAKHSVLNIFYHTDDLELSFQICRIACGIALANGTDDISLDADPLKASIALHLYEPGELTNDHLAVAWEIEQAVAKLAV